MDDEKIEAIANEIGYYQSDKEVHSVTPWFFFNCSVKSMETIRDLAAQHYDPLLAELNVKIESQRKQYEEMVHIAKDNVDNLNAQLTAKDKEVEELKEWLRKSGKLLDMHISENATLRKEVEGLKGEVK